MSKHDIGLIILEGIHDIKAYMTGTETFRVHDRKLKLNVRHPSFESSSLKLSQLLVDSS